MATVDCRFRLNSSLNSWRDGLPEKDPECGARQEAAQKIKICYNQREESLTLDGLGLTTLPDEVFEQLTHLVRLDLSHNALRHLPSGIGQMKKLKQLDLSHNALEDLPPQTWQLTRLEQLDLIQNRLQFLPTTIGDLSRLRVLDLSGNRLTSLPKTIRKLQNLAQLGLGPWVPSRGRPPNGSRNHFRVLPPAIYRLPPHCRVWFDQTSIPPEELAACRARLAASNYRGPKLIYDGETRFGKTDDEDFGKTVAEVLALCQRPTSDQR